MSKIDLTINREGLAHNIQKAKENNIIIPTIAQMQNPDLIPSATATALRVREARDRDLGQAVAGFLADREMLLIFDNFEHLLPAASFLAELLAASPGLRLLVTSRARLRVYGEHEFPILPFHLPQSDDLLDAASADAVRLFLSQPFSRPAPRESFRVKSQFPLPVRSGGCSRGLSHPLSVRAGQIPFFPAPARSPP